ncbi:helix-turn-helix transcriptional regulator [Histidinibacterium aquaticum]|uniref:AlpA family transcriptional regulator n=1 Tax=Histidinibacterium aquaticum TaxID=2613962 RepID=A0A5J5GQ34_9RHOB|nr:AlpA family transcriptional regulator [Histidinibacterium aquaticum]KAA9010175.1 AlpA family transcriptional regulator [Histidinibacterium aquaticum]
MNDRILRLPEVERLTGLSRATIYRMVSRDDFPRQTRIGMRAVGWRESQLNEWLDTQPSASCDDHV